jgi:hypothetical protein
MRKTLVLFIISLLAVSVAFAQTSKMIFPSEDLLYEVSFLGIKLGTIRIVTEGYETFGKYKVVKTVSYIDSYSGIPFVDLHAVYRSWMDPSTVFSYKFTGSTKEQDYWLFDQTIFDYDNKKIIAEKFKKGVKYRSRVIYTTKKWSDGLSIFFLAREFVKSKRNIKIPTVIDVDTCYTYINFVGKRESVKISSIDYPVRTVWFNGRADWTGIYGLTGYFEGWFSDDDASIPIKAKMNVYVGSINIELIKWNRKGWVPPRG